MATVERLHKRFVEDGLERALSSYRRGGRAYARKLDMVRAPSSASHRARVAGGREPAGNPAWDSDDAPSLALDDPVHQVPTRTP